MNATRKLGRPPNPVLQARRRDEILAAAASCFADKGYDETDTQELADQLGVAKGTLYRYFPSKRELFQAAIHRAMDQLRAWVDGQVVNVADPLDRIVAATRAYLTFFEQYPDVVELLVQERALFKDHKSTYFEYRDQHQDDRWPRLIEGLVATGRIRNVPVERILDVLGDLLYGTMFTNHMSGRRRSCEDQARDLIDVAFFGILTDEERRRRENCA